MKENGKQVKNGKAFEYALATTYYEELVKLGINVVINKDRSFYNTEKCFRQVDDNAKNRFVVASKATFNTLVKIEPGLTSPQNENDVLQIRLASDAEGQKGDVRDIIFSRPLSKWEIGISAKNNNEDAKHSRLGPRKNNPNEDWGRNWFGIESTDEFWEEFNPVLKRIEVYQSNGITKWDEIKEKKEDEIYKPALNAFKHEIERQKENNKNLPNALTSYIIGKKPFYKVIKDDNNNLVIVKAFNIKGGLNKALNNHDAKYRTSKIEYPTRIIHFDFSEKRGQKNTLEMVLNKGWSISFRIHNAKKNLDNSLKFAVTLTGNPPVLFSQFLFQEDDL